MVVESYNVTQEIPPSQRPGSLKEWLGEQKKFLAYVTARLPIEARNLNWKSELQKKKKLIQKLVTNPIFNSEYKRIISKISTAISK